MKTIVLEFLDLLAKNNNREWFQENKKKYEEARAEFEAFIESLIPEIARFDESVRLLTAKDCLFRIYRDVRFSKDKSPYKTNFGAFITQAGKKSHGPGYYFHMESSGCFLSGGIYMPSPDIMKMIRQEIYYNIDEFKKILNNKTFRKYFNGIDDWDRQKLPPKEFPKDFPDIELLKNRSFTVSADLDKKLIGSNKLMDYALQVYKTMLPYNDFLRRAVSK